MKIEDMHILMDAIDKNTVRIEQLQGENRRNYEELQRILPDDLKETLLWHYLRTRSGKSMMRRLVEAKPRKIR